MAWRFRISVKHEASQRQVRLWGVEPSWHEAWHWHPTSGDPISREDVDTMARVCLVGRTVKRELFGDEDPVGKRLYANKVSLLVKGVLEARGTSPMGNDFDDFIIVPITTAMRRLMNVDYVGAIRIISADPDLIPEQAKAVRALIHERHHITPPEEDDFRIISPMVIARLARGTSRPLSILLIALAALSLVVGGIVLMNIMLVSVAERTREVGLRRALGATRDDIFAQFLTEALAVTLLGMALGSLLGLGVSALLPRVLGMPAIVSWEPFALALAFALLVGTVFGVLPARRAARLHPVDALR